MKKAGNWLAGKAIAWKKKYARFILKSKAQFLIIKDAIPFGFEFVPG